jgi:hypothetical protein
MLEPAMVKAAVAATTVFNIGHSQTVPCRSRADSNQFAAAGKLMFRNHYSQVMLMYKPSRLLGYSADFLTSPRYTALVARQKAATKRAARALF